MGLCHRPNCTNLIAYKYKKLLSCRIHKTFDKEWNPFIKCIVDTCPVSASSNYPGYPRSYCATHRLDGMIDLKNYLPSGQKRYSKETCIVPNCLYTAHFNTEGKANPLYCFVHKTHDMVKLTHHVRKYNSLKT